MRRAIFLPICLACVPAAEARDYGQHGAVFPVIERDLLEQIHTRLTAMEKSGETKRLNQELQRRTAARVNRPEPVADLVRASAARRWSFDPTITLETDIRGAKGELIHARGTVQNLANQQRFGVKVELELLDAAGKTLATTSDYVSVFEPKSDWNFHAPVTDPKTVSARVTEIIETK